MKSKAEYQKRQAVSRREAYAAWSSVLSAEDRQWYQDMGFTRETFINRYSRIIRKMKRLQYHIKKHGVIVDGQRCRICELCCCKKKE